MIFPDFHSRRFQLKEHPRAVSISPDGSRAAIAFDGALEILSVPEWKTIQRAPHDCESCHFSSNGTLWSSSRRDRETVVFEVWDTANWKIASRQNIRDPYGASHVDLVTHLDPASVVVWFAAGQDGQALVWARYRDGSIHTDAFPELDDTTWPSFNPARFEFLVISGIELHCYEYPKGPLVMKMDWPEVDADDSIGYWTAYLDENRALVSSTEGRLFIADLDVRKLTHELQIKAGHLSVLMPYRNGKFLSVHRPTLTGSEHRVVIWESPANLAC